MANKELAAFLQELIAEAPKKGAKVKPSAKVWTESARRRSAEARMPVVEIQHILITQVCDCGETHTYYSGQFIDRENSKSSLKSKVIRRESLTPMEILATPERIMRREENVPICAVCVKISEEIDMTFDSLAHRTTQQLSLFQ